MWRTVIARMVVVLDIYAAIENDKFGREPRWLREPAPFFSAN
jgi:hypothetical protein